MITCGTQVVAGSSGGGASLPATPADALLDASATDTMVGLNGSGVGQALSASAARTRMGLGALAVQSTVTASQISDATTAGRTVLTAADAAAQRTALGLGGAAVLNVGSGSGDVAPGNVLDGVGAGLGTTPAVGQTAADGNLRAIVPNTTGTATTSGVGTASASSTSVTLAVDGTTLATWYSGTYNAPRATITPQSAWTAPAISPHRMQATARIASRSGSGASFTNTVAILGIDGGAAYRYGIYAKASTVGSENESSTGATGLVSTTSAGLSWDGNDWLRVRVEGPQITFYFARGSGGAAPAETAWVAIGSTTYTVAANFVGFAVVLVLVQSTSGAGGAGPTIVFDNITIRRLP